jgi:nucleoside-diphosphate-sugar epimerase
MSNQVIIVTGSCGRIGANVVRRLSKDYRIVGFELLKALYASANEELVPVDLASDESVHQAFMHIRNFYGNKIASVIHLAAYYSFSDPKYDNYERITVKGTERLLNSLQQFEVGQFIFSSTMLIHAPCQRGEKICEDSPIVPKWAYPKSKVATEEIIHRLHGRIPTVNLRIAGVYDDQCHSIPISHQIQRIYEKKLEAHLFAGDLNNGASFLHMDDLVDAIELCVKKREELPPELNLLVGEPTTLSYDDLQRQISRYLYGKEIKTYSIPKPLAKLGSFFQNHIPFLPPPFIKPWMIDFADDNYCLDISLAKRFLGWEPRKSLEKTLPLMLDFLKQDPIHWYKANGLEPPHHLKNIWKKTNH